MSTTKLAPEAALMRAREIVAECFFVDGDPEAMAQRIAAALDSHATAVRVETWREAIRVAQLSAQKSEDAGLSITSAEILIRRLENAAAAPPALAAHSVKENETDEETNTR